MAAAANDPGAASGVLLRRAFRHASSVVAALAALAPRLVRLAHHDYPTDSYGKTSAFPLASPSSVVDQLHVAGAEAGRRVGRSRAGRGVVADTGDPDLLGAQLRVGLAYYSTGYCGGG